MRARLPSRRFLVLISGASSLHLAYACIWGLFFAMFGAGLLRAEASMKKATAEAYLDEVYVAPMCSLMVEMTDET